MRVLVLTNLFPPHAYGGYERTCDDVVRRWRRDGHEVVVLTSDTRVPGVTGGDDEQVRRELVAWWDWEANAQRQLRLRHVIGALRHDQRVLRDALDRLRPDVVSVWQLSGLPLTLLRLVERSGTPTVLVLGDDWLHYADRIDLWHRIVSRLPRVLRGAVASTVGVETELPTLHDATVAAVSAMTAARARQAAQWQLGEVHVVPPGVDTTDFPVEPLPERPWRWRVLYVGRTDPAKGLDTLVDAVALLPAQATLTLVGGGNTGYRERLLDRVRSAGLGERVTASVLPRGRLREHYRDHDVVVFPSEWDEPFGLVPLEAMACGVPVVATAAGGSADYLVDGDNCVVVPRSDAGAIARAVERLADDPSLRSRLTDGGRRTVSGRTADDYADALLELHRRAAAGDRRREETRC